MNVHRRVPRRALGGVLLTSLGGLALSCSPEETSARKDLFEPTPGGPRPNIIIYLVDTLRRDHLGVYGYPRDTSPRLDAFAEDAVVLLNGTAPSSWTRPSTASLLSGLHPLRHGAITGKNRIGDHVALLGEYLKQLGYHTAAFVTNPNVIPAWGFGRGFDQFYDIESLSRSTRADEVNRRLFEHLSKRPDRPFFFYVHTRDPHFPYDPPAPYDRRYGARNSAAPLPERTHAVHAQTPPDVIEGLRARYDGEVAFNDACFGELLDRLKEDSLYEDAMVVFVSDHGEEFHEHEGAGHGHTLYEEQLRIPMLVKFPENLHGGRKVDATASLMDIVPTVLETLGQTAPPGLDGVDIGGLLLTEAGRPERPLLFDLNRHGGRRAGQNIVQAVTLGGWKYIQVFEPSSGEMLFNVATDPRERHNLITSERDKAEALAGLAARMTSRSVGGVHLILINAPSRHARHRMEGTLRTSGAFVKLQTWEFEDGDRAALSDNGGTLTFEVETANRENPIGRMPRYIVDEDNISFMVDPPDAPITVESFEVSGENKPRLHLGPGKKRCKALPVTIRQNAADLQTTSLGDLLTRGNAEFGVNQLGAYLVVVPQPERVEATVDADVTARLRALGYVDGDTE